MPEESQKPAEAAPVKEQAIPEDEDLFEDFAEEGTSTLSAHDLCPAMLHQKPQMRK